MAFPRQRLRRLRQDDSLRRMVRETSLASDNLIYPLFVTWGEGRQEPIEFMPGHFRWSVDLLVKEAAEAKAAGHDIVGAARGATAPYAGDAASRASP